MQGTVVVTGAAGYIGSHVLVSLIQAGYRPIAVDDLSNGSHCAIERVEELTGVRIPLEVVDLTEPGAADGVMARYGGVDAPVLGVIHLAGRKAVAESVSAPLMYYEANVCATVQLMRAMQKHNVPSMVFSSSATVYGCPSAVPVTEQSAVGPTNPYGRTKLIVEGMLQDMYAADPRLRVAILRYFNPIGAHPSGRIGEDPHGEPANLFPYLTQVAAGRRKHVSVFGMDYETPDGTGIRDYLHVVDLAEGHVLALEKLLASAGCLVLNLGTGRGASVLELIRTFEEVSGLQVPIKVAPRRPGDIAAIWADPTQAQQTLGWKAQRSLHEMCADGWRWQRNNPNGYVTNEAQTHSLRIAPSPLFPATIKAG